MSQHEMFSEINAAPDEMLANMPDLEITEKLPQMIVDWVDAVAATYVRAGKTDEDARDLAMRAVIAICELDGGRTLYIAKPDKARDIIRDKRVYHKFNGNNIHALAKQHNLTERMIYNIVREQRALHIKRIQPELNL